MPKFLGGKRDVYIAVAERYERYIRLGVLKDGDKLPSVRTAAGELGVNPNTVQKSYCHLEEMGLISSLPKKGAFVTYRINADANNEENRAEVLRALDNFKEKGITKSDIISILEEVYADD